MNEFIVFIKRFFSLFMETKKQTKCLNGKYEKQQAAATAKLSVSSDVIYEVEAFFDRRYEFRFNRISETTEYRERSRTGAAFATVGPRELNSLCIAARKEKINCWDRDVSRYVNSADIPAHHPFEHFMGGLPAWDGTDRVDALARRVSAEKVWTDGFHRWMLGVAAQWMGRQTLHANSVAPVLVSRKQGKHKSTFCKMLVPDALQGYYTDSFDLTSVAASEQKLTVFGLINLDELDKYSPRKMAGLKNLMQMASLNIRKAYKKNYASLPRIASFIATSNQKELLTDPSGSRRFLCVEIHDKIDCSPIDHAQIYAQLKAELDSGTRYWFTGEEEAEIMRHNAAFQKQGMEEDVLFACYRAPEAGEKSVLLSGAHIYDQLKKKHPSAMRAASPVHFCRTLTSVGIERVHTERGNLYRVVPVA